MITTPALFAEQCELASVRAQDNDKRETMLGALRPVPLTDSLTRRRELHFEQLPWLQLQNVSGANSARCPQSQSRLDT